MRIIRHFSRYETIENSILTIGNFDGVHIGHQELIREVYRLAEENNTSSVLITFEPHPSSVLSYKKNFRIISLYNKILTIKKLGINILYLQHFTRTFAKISAQEFIENILIKYFSPKHIIIGYDFVFGNNREGNGQLLQQYTESYNIGFTRFYPVKMGGQNVSSSLIRKLLTEGRIKEASCLLGYEYYITGFAINKGNISEKLKLPVAEMYLYNILCPKLGVYKSTVEINNSFYEALVNIKMDREGKATGCLEIYILNCKYELHNRRIQVKLLDKVDDGK